MSDNMDDPVENCCECGKLLDVWDGAEECPKCALIVCLRCWSYGVHSHAEESD